MSSLFKGRGLFWSHGLPDVDASPFDSQWAWSHEESAAMTPQQFGKLLEQIQQLTAMVVEIHAREASKPQIDPKARYSLSDAGRYLDTSPSTLKRRARAQKLAMHYDGKTPFIMGAELLRYAREGAARKNRRRAADRK